jgi:hypothetical protein
VLVLGDIVGGVKGRGKPPLVCVVGSCMSQNRKDLDQRMMIFLLQISRFTHFEAFETEAEVRSTQWLSLGGDRDQMYQIIKREACHPTRHGLPEH